jgi:hypothetical protein
LGTSKAKYTLTLLSGGTFTKDNHEYSTYGYIPRVDELVEILNIKFQTTIMTFNDSDKLVSFDFIKFYKKEEKPNFEKEARKNYRQIIKYFSEELNSKGVSKTSYSPYKKSDITKEQIWAYKNSSLTVRKSSTTWHTSIQVIINTPGN